MKIVDVKSYVLGTVWRNLTFVRVITDDGLEGAGEVRMVTIPMPCQAISQKLCPAM